MMYFRIFHCDCFFFIDTDIYPVTQFSNIWSIPVAQRSFHLPVEEPLGWSKVSDVAEQRGEIQANNYTKVINEPTILGFPPSSF